MAHIDGVLLTPLLIVYRVVGTIVENDAVLQDLAHSGALVEIGRLEHVDRSCGIGGHGTGKELATGAETELCRTEGVLHGAIGTRLRDESAGRGG